MAGSWLDALEERARATLPGPVFEYVAQGARDGTSKAANRFNTFALRPADTDRLAPPGDVDGPPDADGIRRTKTGWRRVLPGKKADGASDG